MSLLAQSRHKLVHCTCLLLNQSVGRAHRQVGKKPNETTGRLRALWLPLFSRMGSNASEQVRSPCS